jgi:hypothetical protein
VRVLWNKESGTHHRPSRLIASPIRSSTDAVVVVVVVEAGGGVVRLGKSLVRMLEHGIEHSPSSQRLITSPIRFSIDAVVAVVVVIVVVIVVEAGDGEAGSRW